MSISKVERLSYCATDSILLEDNGRQVTRCNTQGDGRVYIAQDTAPVRGADGWKRNVS